MKKQSPSYLTIKAFYSLEDLQEYIRENGADDVIALNGIIYTMDFYDGAGKEITYGNKTTGNGLRVDTFDRYGEKGFSDARVIETKDHLICRAITYFDENDN